MMICSKLKKALTVTRISTLLKWETLVNKKVYHSNNTPPSVESVTCQWLTASLCQNHPGAEVVSFRHQNASSGTTDRYKLTVSYNDIGTTAQLPTALFAKTTPSLTTRLVAGSGTGPNEAGFYNDVRPWLNIEAPTSVFSGYKRRSSNAFILLENIAETRNVNFIDVRTPVDRTMIESMLELLATVHGSLWGSPKLEQLDWLQTALTQQQAYNESIAFEQRSMIGIDRASKVIPASVMVNRHKLWPAYMKSLSMHSKTPATLTHSDVHLGNWYQTPEGEMGLSDWQALCIGSWASDFSYLLFGALTTENRRAWEKELLEIYLHHLSKVITPPSFDQAWLEYRQHTLHSFFFWVFTIGAGALEPDMQPDEFSLINIERMAQGIEDLETLDALKL